MKKIIKVLLVILIASTLALTIVACDKTCTDGEHVWGEWETTAEATCTEGSVLTRTCSVCGETDTTTADDALGHSILSDDGSLIDCSTVDLEQGLNCDRCDSLLTGEDLAALLSHGSTRIVVAKDPTCTESGTTRGHKCVVCGTILDGVEEVPALGHEQAIIPATDATCTEPAYGEGLQCARCKLVFEEPQPVAPALGHDLDSSASYFTFTECKRCHHLAVLESDNVYSEYFVYDFDEDIQAAIDQLYQEIEDAIKGLSNVAPADFVEMFDEYDTQISYIQSQYQFAQIAYDINYDSASRSDYMTISEYYNTSIDRYYSLFGEINESKYGSYFWEWTGWSEAEIAEVLEIAGSYDLENQNAVDEITRAYEDLMDRLGWNLSSATKAQLLQLYDLYNKLVTANNNIAATAGYDNYMEYAYANVYERDYTPDEAQAMRNYVREYIGPILADTIQKYMDFNEAYSNRGGWTTQADQLYYSMFAAEYMFRDMEALYAAGDTMRAGMVSDLRQNMSDYFAFLSEGAGADEVNFYDEVNALFRNGNYFLGTNPNRTAYTWYIYSLDLPMLLFTDGYKDAFTFVHEFGHYFQFAYNDRLGVSMDQDETQSQGDEMLFLAWLSKHIPEGITEGFELLELEQLYDMLGIMVMATAVDEFEYLVYTGATEFNGQPIATVKLSDGTEVIDYNTLYTQVMLSYWDEIDTYYNTAYWSFVVFDQAAYYISYAMSALPALEIYAKAGIDGLESARDSYLKLFTFSNEEQFVTTDIYEYEDGSVYVDRYLNEGVTYEKILNWAGLSGPFQEELYQLIEEFFANR